MKCLTNPDHGAGAPRVVVMSNTDVPGEKTVQKSAYRQPVTPEGLKAMKPAPHVA